MTRKLCQQASRPTAHRKFPFLKKKKKNLLAPRVSQTAVRPTCYELDPHFFFYFIFFSLTCHVIVMWSLLWLLSKWPIVLVMFIVLLTHCPGDTIVPVCYVTTPIFLFTLLYFHWLTLCHVIIMWSHCDLLFLWWLLFRHVYCSVTHCPGWLYCPCDIYCSCDSIVLFYYKY